MLETKRMGRVVLLMLVLAGAGMTAMAQTGKIAGRVIEASTGEPLPGVNVFIEGTTRGSTTDLDGQYVMIGVRPGTYTIIASFIGFATERREGVGVNLDLTTTVDFSLREEVIQGEEIIVTADAIAVRKDVTSSEARVTADKIEQLPATELGQILEVQAGITNRDGLHIRGGRSSEVLFMVDGVPVSDSYDGSQAVQLENDGIQELQVISGTFNAEYGNAMSGVINVVTKEGSGDRFTGSAEVYTGSYVVSHSDDGAAFLRGTRVAELQDPKTGVLYRGVDPYSYLSIQPTQFQNAKLSLEGPIVGDKVTFFALGRYFKNDGWLYGARLFNVDGTRGDSALVPMNSSEKFSWQSNIRFRLGKNVTLNAIGLGSINTNDDLGASGYLPYRWNPDGIRTYFDNGYDAKLKLTHILSPRTFYTLDVATFYRKAESYLYEDLNDPRYNDWLISPPDSVLTGGGRFLRGGTDLGRFQRSTRSYMVKFDLSSQIGQHHLVKGGILGRVDQLDFEAFGLIPAIDPSGNPVVPFQPAVPVETSSDFNAFDNAEPLTLSGYIQDKLEFDSFIVNAGLRVDYFDSRAQLPADSEDPNIFNPLKKINRFRDTNGDGVITVDEEVASNALTVADREAYWYTDADPKVQVSPRLGVAYPITAEGVIHFSFGLFLQIPTLNNLFDNSNYKLPTLSGFYGPFGNPNLKAQKTTMYEIGFKQGFGAGKYVVDMTAYYRDVRNWVSTSTLIASALPGVNYVIYTNRDYANTRGFTVTLSRPYQQNYGFDFSYTYQVVEGSNSNPADEFFSLQGNNQPTLALLPLNWDQRHKVAGAIYGGAGGWNASLRLRLESGFPYTPSFPSASIVGNDVQPEFSTNSRRLPAAYEADLTVSKTFDTGRLKPRVYVEVFNLLDTRNVTAVYSDTGLPDLTLEQFRQGSVDPGFWIQPGFYREPRRVQLGLDFRF
ncbi:MAG: TonB-dependent receptor [Rhodothermales bacterium]